MGFLLRTHKVRETGGIATGLAVVGLARPKRQHSTDDSADVSNISESLDVGEGEHKYTGNWEEFLDQGGYEVSTLDGANISMSFPTGAVQLSSVPACLRYSPFHVRPGASKRCCTPLVKIEESSFIMSCATWALKEP